MNHNEKYGFCLSQKPLTLTEAYFGHKMSPRFQSVNSFLNIFRSCKYLEIAHELYSRNTWMSSCKYLYCQILTKTGITGQIFVKLAYMES
jgi:hypothetical protein